MGNCTWCEIPEWEDYYLMPSDETNILNQVINKRYNILLAGSGSVGKSTIFRCINNSNHNKNEICNIIRATCCSEMMELLKQSQSLYEAAPKDNASCFIDLNNDKQTLQLLQSFIDLKYEMYHSNQADNRTNEELQTLGNAIYYLWCLDAIQQTFHKRLNESFNICDNMEYLFDKIQEIMSQNYIVTAEDIIKIYMRSSGFRSVIYRGYSNCRLRFMDVGGQRNERKKWIHTMGSLDCLVYVCALDQFCVRLVEDVQMLGFTENLNLFTELCKSRYLRNKFCDVMVILNKTDVFYKYLVHNSLDYCFGEYKGRNYRDLVPMVVNVYCRIAVVNSCVDIITGYIGSMDILCYSWLDLCYKDGIEFIERKFKSRNGRRDKQIKFFELCAINKSEVYKTLQNIEHELILSKVDLITELQCL